MASRIRMGRLMKGHSEEEIVAVEEAIETLLASMSAAKMSHGAAFLALGVCQRYVLEVSPQIGALMPILLNLGGFGEPVKTPVLSLIQGGAEETVH